MLESCSSLFKTIVVLTSRLYNTGKFAYLKLLGPIVSIEPSQKYKGNNKLIQVSTHDSEFYNFNRSDFVS